MDIVHCKDCEHWWECEKGWGRDGFGVCTLGESTDSCPTHTTLAYAVDQEGYRARLVTSPAFGCVQGKRRG